MTVRKRNQQAPKLFSTHGPSINPASDRRGDHQTSTDSRDRPGAGEPRTKREFSKAAAFETYRDYSTRFKPGARTRHSASETETRICAKAEADTDSVTCTGAGSIRETGLCAARECHISSGTCSYAASISFAGGRG